MSSTAFDVNSLSNRFRNRLVVAYPLVTYVVALTFSSRACFLLFPQQWHHGHTPSRTIALLKYKKNLFLHITLRKCQHRFGKKASTWDKSFYILLEFEKADGHIHVPYKGETRSLAKWRKHQWKMSMMPALSKRGTTFVERFRRQGDSTGWKRRKKPRTASLRKSKLLKRSIDA
jgi:hypothetical protein